MHASLLEFLERAPASSSEIQAATGLSQSGVSRQIQTLGDRIIRLKFGRTPRYALSRNAFGADDKLPLFTVDAYGNNTAIAVIRPLAHGGFFVAPLPGLPRVYLGHSGSGLYDDLPFFLDDLRPQGFLGRQIAAELSRRSADFPADLRNWQADHIGRYLISNGDDLPGNLQFGPQAHIRLRRPVDSVTADRYPEMAERVTRGLIPGSSAGGEQPKFTAYCADRACHVIVKFSPTGDDRVARRWRDILLTEHHATEALHAQNQPAAETRLIESGGRLFLESQRFDRSGEFGRLPMLSLQAVDNEFTGLGTDWPQVMQALYDQRLVSWQHLFDAEMLWTFGQLIHNTDMHLGNLSLAPEGDVFRILPAYDMCSMGFAPQAGEVVPYYFPSPNIGRRNLDQGAVSAAANMAADFWNRLRQDERASDEFRQFMASGQLERAFSALGA